VIPSNSLYPLFYILIRSFPFIPQFAAADAKQFPDRVSKVPYPSIKSNIRKKVAPAVVRAYKLLVYKVCESLLLTEAAKWAPSNVLGRNKGMEPVHFSQKTANSEQLACNHRVFDLDVNEARYHRFSYLDINEHTSSSRSDYKWRGDSVDRPCPAALLPPAPTTAGWEHVIAKQLQIYCIYCLQ
jgi:hypothetical protein